ncbi:MAG: ATP-binding cassette domain-containing protein [Nitrososphaerales archaeon]
MAAIIVNLNDIHHTYFDTPILTGLSWEIQAGQKIGLVGPNGGGKSTLLKLILGILQPDSGAIFKQRGLTIGYLPQEVTADALAGEAALAAGNGAATLTVLEAGLSGSPEIARLRHALALREAQMGDPAVYGDERRLTRVMEEHARLLHAYEAAGGLTYENRVRSTLRDLGLGEDALEQPVGVLSGGQAKLVGLARLMVWTPDLLLLDEPDNHLDLEGKARVEKLICGYGGTVVIVSHDRYLLDETVNAIAELERGQTKVWPGSYSSYAVNKQLALLRQEQLYRAQQKRITQIEAAIKRFEEAAAFTQNERHARQARSRHKMLERMDKIERPQEASRMRLELGGWRGSNKVLDVQRVDKWFEDPATGDLRVVLEGVSFQVWHGERVGLVGPNGAGKSVLFRCILGEALKAGNLPAAIANGNSSNAAPADLAYELGVSGADGAASRSLFERPDGGVIKLGPSVKIGYYAQQHETLHPDWTLVQEIRDAKPMYETDAVAILQRFLFDYYAAQKQVHHLSGGERSRLQLAKLMLSDVNFLMLDEPTNNLDIPSSEVLESALEEFNGTVLVISHDRYFLDRIVDRVAVLEGGTSREIVGGYSDYVDS